MSELDLAIGKFLKSLEEMSDFEKKKKTQLAASILNQLAIYTRAPYPTGGKSVTSSTIHCPDCNKLLDIELSS